MIKYRFCIELFLYFNKSFREFAFLKREFLLTSILNLILKQNEEKRKLSKLFSPKRSDKIKPFDMANDHDFPFGVNPGFCLI